MRVLTLVAIALVAFTTFADAERSLRGVHANPNAVEIEGHHAAKSVKAPAVHTDTKSEHKKPVNHATLAAQSDTKAAPHKKDAEKEHSVAQQHVVEKKSKAQPSEKHATTTKVQVHLETATKPEAHAKKKATDKKAAEKKKTDKKQPVEKKTTEKKQAVDKKQAAKKPTEKKTTDKKQAVDKKPAVKKPAEVAKENADKSKHLDKKQAVKKHQ